MVSSPDPMSGLIPLIQIYPHDQNELATRVNHSVCNSDEVGKKRPEILQIQIPKSLKLLKLHCCVFHSVYPQHYHVMESDDKLSCTQQTLAQKPNIFS